jgi:putative inorganic carbon (hco3(-)) transporter
VAELIWRLRGATGPAPGARRGDLWWVLGFGGAAALALGWALTLSVQAACAFVLVLIVIALYWHDREWGIFALFGFWFVAPMIRRWLGLKTGYVSNDPLSLAPFLATAALAAFELMRVHVPREIRRVLLLAAAGFAIGLPVGLLSGPRAALYAFVAYLTGVAGAALGLREGLSVRDSTLRRVLLFGMPLIAVYAIVQRELLLPSWDLTWLQSIEFASVGDPSMGPVRAFGSLNGPGALAPLLGLSLLCYLTIHRARPIVIAGAVLVAVALSVTFVRSAWVALIFAGIAHVIATNGRSARVVFGAAALMVATSIALSPVSSTAKDVVDRFNTITNRDDTSTTERSSTVSETLPTAVTAPFGHGVGSAGEASKLLTGESDLRHPDNGYLALMYQSGPVGFLFVLAALAYILIAAWNGARARAPGQEMRQLLFAMLVFLGIVLWTGDSFYGSHGVILWFIGGQVLANQYRLRANAR